MISPEPELEETEFQPLPFLVLSRQGKVLHSNDQVAVLLRASSSIVRGMPLSVHLPPARVQPFFDHLWDAFQQPGVSVEGESELLRTDGTRARVVLFSQVSPEAGKWAKQCQTVVVPQAALHPDHLTGSLLFEKLPFGLAWLDADERILECSPSLSRLLDFHPEQLRGCPVARLFTDWHREAVMSAALRGSAVRLQGVSRDGSLIPVELQIRLTLGGTEKSNPILLIFRDLRDQEDLERRSLRIAELERQSVGRDLHDALGQNMIGMAFMADELAYNLESGESSDPELAETAKKLAQLCRETTGIARNLVRGLAPVALAEGGLAAAIRDMASCMSGRSAVSIRTRCQAVDVPSEFAEHLYRIAQEAVNNALKHSGCGLVEVELKAQGDFVLLNVRDDGTGIQEGDQQRFGTGLHSMRHRCKIIGALLSVKRVPNGGTEVSVRQPVRWAERETPLESLG